MITSVAEGLERYKQELREHKQWSDRIKEDYGERLKEHGPMCALDNDDWQEAQKRSAGLKAIVKVLGLTPEEEAAIDREIGIAQPQPANASH